jgi:hypothetical protein
VEARRRKMNFRHYHHQNRRADRHGGGGGNHQNDEDVDNPLVEIYSHVRRTFPTMRKVSEAKVDDDITYLLQVMVWESARYNRAGNDATAQGWFPALFGQSKRQMDASLLTPPQFLNMCTVNQLVCSYGVIADVFASRFDTICGYMDRASNDFVYYQNLKDRIFGPENSMKSAQNQAPADPYDALSLSSDLQDALIRLKTLVDGQATTQACYEFCKSKLMDKLVTEAAELRRAYILNLGDVGDIVSPFIEDEDKQAFFDNRVIEVNNYLKERNAELAIQRANYVKLCELIEFSQSEIATVLENTGFNKTDIYVYATRVAESLQAVRNCFNANVTLTICGETSTGKTTLVAGIVGALCFPTSQAANSACPIRIRVDSNAVHRTFHVAKEFHDALMITFLSIRAAMRSLRDAGMSLVMPVSVVSEEAQDMYLKCLGEAQLTLEPQAGDDNAICSCINDINGLVRLIYNLKGCPRFSNRLEGIHPLAVLINAVNIIDILPTVTAPCPCTLGLPFLGKINFIDTQGVSETGKEEGGSFMEYTIAIIKKIFEQTARTIILTTPTGTSSTSFRELRSILRRCDGADKMLIAINKFDEVEAKNGGLEHALKRIRNEFAKEVNSAINVQTLSAILLRDCVFGLQDLKMVGGMGCIRTKKDQLSLPASSLLTALYGGTVAKKVTNRGKPLPPEKIAELDEELERDCEDLFKQSNFNTIIRLALQPAFLTSMERLPPVCLGRISSGLSALINTLSTRLASRLDKSRAIQLLADAILKIEAFLDVNSMRSVRIDEVLREKFVAAGKVGAVELKKKIHDTIQKCENTVLNLKASSFFSRQVKVDAKIPFLGPDHSISYTSSVATRIQSDCENENARIKGAIDSVFASSAIEATWEQLRKEVLTGPTSIIADDLKQLGDSINASFELADKRLVDVFESLKLDILNCSFADEIPAMPKCACNFTSRAERVSVSVVKTVSTQARSWRTLWFAVTVKHSVKEDFNVFVPQYGVLEEICNVIVDQSYNELGCTKQLNESKRGIAFVLDTVHKKLKELLSRLQSLHRDMLDNAETKDDKTLKHAISALSKPYEEHEDLRAAICERSPLENLASIRRNRAAAIGAWRTRLEDGNLENLTQIVGDSPLAGLFNDVDKNVGYDEATSYLLTECSKIESLKPFRTELEAAVGAALANAQDQDSKRRRPNGMDVDELAALKLYTYPCCYFSLLNKALREIDVDFDVLRVMRKLVLLTLRALKALPRIVDGAIVWRGVELDMTSKFHVGQTVVWPGFTSTSRDKNVSSSHEFLGCPQPGEVLSRTLFEIHLDPSNARSLQKVSMLEEEEVLLPPFSVFEVTEVADISDDGLLLVKLAERPRRDPIMEIGVLVEDRNNSPIPPLVEALEEHEWTDSEMPDTKSSEQYEDDEGCFGAYGSSVQLGGVAELYECPRDTDCSRYLVEAGEAKCLVDDAEEAVSTKY